MLDMESTEENFSVIEAWFQSLGTDRKKALIESLKIDVKSFFEEQSDPIEEDFNNMLTFVREQLKSKDQETIRVMLRNNGLNDDYLIEQIIESTWDNLKMYRHANLLRNVDKAVFSFVIGTIMKDIYVDREYDSISKLADRLKLDDEYKEDDIKNTNILVDFLLYNYFSQLGSLDDLTSLMEDMRFDEDKRSIFLELLKVNKDGLEKYYLFLNLLIITEEISNIREVLKK